VVGIFPEAFLFEPAARTISIPQCRHFAQIIPPQLLFFLSI